MSSLRLEYVWIDNDYHLRSKMKVVHNTCIDTIRVEDIPEWNYDGSSTNQSSGSDSEVIIKPCRMFSSKKDMFHILVLCDTYTPLGEPLKTNNRNNANEIFKQKLETEPWFGIEQE